MPQGPSVPPAAANLLWDTAITPLGVDTKGKLERVVEQHAAFRQRIAELFSGPFRCGSKALDNFYANYGHASLAADPLAWPEIVEGNPVVTFRLHNDGDLICQRPAVIAGRGDVVEEGGKPGFCLVTGQAAPPNVCMVMGGTWGAQSPALRWCPSTDAASTTRSRATMRRSVRWAASLPTRRRRPTRRPSPPAHPGRRCLDGVLGRRRMMPRIEEGFAAIFGERDDPDARAEQVRALLGAVQSGQFDGGRGDKLLYVGFGAQRGAGFRPLRHAAPLHEIARQIRQWFADLKVVRSAKDPEYPSLFRLLAACAQQGKADNIPPNLGGDIMRAILSGSPFPATWLNAAVLLPRRQNVTTPRAAAIKASLNRLQRLTNQSRQGVVRHARFRRTPARPTGWGAPASRAAGKIQEEASPGSNATIRERYYGAASSTPVAVFTTLLRLKNHHLRNSPPIAAAPSISSVCSAKSCT